MPRDWTAETLMAEVVQPSLAAMFTADELAELDVELSQNPELFLQGVPESLRLPFLETRGFECTWYLRIALGKDVFRHYLLWSTDDLTADALGRRLRDNLQDFIAESSFAWGQLRPID